MGSFLLFLNIICACVNTACVANGIMSPYIGIPLIGFNVGVGMMVHVADKNS